MPEGDTIFRAARTLAQRLEGKKVLRFHSTVPALATARLEGALVARVESHGKYLDVCFDDGRVLSTHMKMTGSWHVYRPGERWYQPAHRARAVIEVSDCVAVCFAAPVVELHASPARLAQARHGRLGPDILAADFDAARAAERLLTKPSLSIGEALLDQSLTSGIGNVYKSESLFLERLSPFAKTGSIPRERLAALMQRAKLLMIANVAPGSGMRTTRGTGPGASRHWVYGRSGRQRLACGELVRMRRDGAALRSTYYCPSCQHTDAGEDGSL
ncbi:MAG TPA: DNA-formamidopyrimidine glycosylase family protein [Polyangiaceae bacterium]|nr:DNA-formamidopyrimidine glycosylase family protein [Polyangiaceae bacterium]